MSKDSEGTSRQVEISGYYANGFQALKKQAAYVHELARSQSPDINEEAFNFFDYRLSAIEISQENSLELLQHAQEVSYVRLGYETLYVQNISQGGGLYQSLIHRIGLAPLKTTETTSEIMKRHFKQKGVPYETIQQIGKLLGINKFCPYLVGDSCFLPDFGKNHATTSWIALHQVIDSQQLTKEKGTYLFCRNNYRVLLPISSKRFMKRVENAASLYHMQRSMLRFLTGFFAHEIAIEVQEPCNIIQQFLVKMHFALPDYSLIEVMDYLKYFWTSETLKKNFGVEDPYLKQIYRRFELSTENKRK